MRDAQTVATPWVQAWRQQLREHRVAALGLGVAGRGAGVAPGPAHVAPPPRAAAAAEVRAPAAYPAAWAVSHWVC